MKIVHVVLGKANPRRANGVNRVAHALASAQAAAGAEVEIWGITPTPNAPTTARSYTLRLFAAAARAWQLDPALSGAVARASEGTVFHFHGGYHPEFFRIARRLARRGLPWVLTPHGAYRQVVVQRRWLVKRPYIALVDGFLLRRARAVHVFSERERRELHLVAPHARTVVLPNGVDLAEYVPIERARRPALVFGFCGRLDARTKGLDLLLEAFARHAQTSDIRLLLVGDGADRTSLEERARDLGIATRVEFTGTLYGEAQRAALARMDVFCHPSRNEGMPTAVLEAAATGLPCIVTTDTNLGDAVSRYEAGLVLPRADAHELAQALSCCMRLDAALRLGSMSTAARTMVEREFDAAVLGARSLTELYGCAASSTSRAA